MFILLKLSTGEFTRILKLTFLQVLSLENCEMKIFYFVRGERQQIGIVLKYKLRLDKIDIYYIYAIIRLTT